ncbi:MAG: nucleotidyl transferase AbiEii/AbiGii toxin family protein [Planctomycetota bacterium]
MKRYPTPEAFRQALEQRLRTAARHGADFARRRQLLVFDRFLARITSVFGDRVVLKGGLVLELRLAQARTTRDVDLHLAAEAAASLPGRLQEAASLDLGDGMTFEVVVDPDHATITNPGMRYDGQRFRATCRLAGKLYGQPFGVDVGFGDPILGKPDVVVAADLLGFAGIPPPKLRLYPVVTHVAEKLHAYTMPRPTPNSRVKDLPDLALLAGTGAIAAAELREACESTFAWRNTHKLPAALPAAPEAWQVPYATLARKDRLSWPTLAAVTEAVRAFLDPLLAGSLRATWNPAAWNWRAAPSKRGS